MNLSPSQIATWNRCKRSWLLSYHRQLTRPPVVGAASAGTAMHRLLAEAAGGEPADLDTWYAEARKARPEQALELIGERKGAIASVESAAAEITVMDTGNTVVATELELDVPIGFTPGGEPVHIYGFADLVLRDASGRLIVRDWKSKTSFRLPGPMELNGQLRSYVLALSELFPGEPLALAEIVMVKRHKGSGRAKGPFTEQHVVAYNQATIDAHRWHVLHIAAQIEEAETKLAAGIHPDHIAPPTAGDHCSFMCSFTSVCPRMDSDPAAAEAMLLADFIPRTSPSTAVTPETPAA